VPPSVRATKGGQRRQQALHLSRAMPRQAILPEVITCRAAASACEKGASGVSRPYISCERGGAMLSCRMRSRTVQPSGGQQRQRSFISHERYGARPSCRVRPRTVQPSVRAKKGGPAASAGFTSLTSNAAPRYRAGCDPVLCGRQGVRRRASSASRPYTSPERCGAMLGCRRRRPPELQRLEESHPMCEHRQGGVKTPRPGSKKRRRMATAKSGGRG